MIKSVISRLYGTRETLLKLHEINLELRSLPHNSKEKSGMAAIFDKLVNSCCKFWKDDCIETGNLESERWVWHSKCILPRSKKDKWNVSEEEWNVSSWKLDICLKLITHAKSRVGYRQRSTLVCF